MVTAREVFLNFEIYLDARDKILTWVCHYSSFNRSVSKPRGLAWKMNVGLAKFLINAELSMLSLTIICWKKA